MTTPDPSSPMNGGNDGGGNNNNNNDNNINPNGTITNIIFPLMIKFGTVFTTLLAIAVTLLYANQDKLLYIPQVANIPRLNSENPEYHRHPSEYKMKYESHKVECEDGILIHLWVLLQEGEERAKNVPTLLFFHGNAGNIGLRLPNANHMYQSLQCNIILVEYRGYGESSSSVQPNEIGLKLDAEASLQFALDHPLINNNLIFVFGRSLGGAVAFHLAEKQQQQQDGGGGGGLAGLIVENTFMSIGDMVDHLMPWLKPFKRLVLRIGWDSMSVIQRGRVKVPVLFLAGDTDTLVPHSHMLRLHQAIVEKERAAASSSSSSSGGVVVKSRMHVVKGGTHNDTWMRGKRDYWDAIRTFLLDVTSARRLGPVAAVAVDNDVGGGGESVESVEVGADGSQQGASLIPTMPSDMVGIIKGAASSSSSSSSQRHDDQKKDK